MSIIYDALRKSQRARLLRKSHIVARVFQPNRKQVALTLLLLSGLTLLVVLFMLATSSPVKLAEEKAPVPKPIINPKTVTAFKAPRLILDGVFLSDKEQLAMINRHTYHIGDKLYGMQVASISFEKVILKGKSHSIVLQNSLAQIE